MIKTTHTLDGGKFSLYNWRPCPQQSTADMFLPKVQIVLFWRATRCGFSKNCSKKPKLIHSLIVKIWLFLWKSTSGSTKIADFQFLSNFWPIIAQKRQKKQKWPILVLPDVDSTKIAKSSLFDYYFWHFWAIFGKTTSGCSPKQDYLDL